MPTHQTTDQPASSGLARFCRSPKALLRWTFALATLAVTASSPAATPWLTTSGNQLRDPNGNRVIMRGVSLIDIGAQQTWDGAVTAMIDRLTNTYDTQGSSPGFYAKVVRLPIVPQGYGSPWTWAPNDGDNFYNNLLRPVVNYCKSKDIYCIIDLHYVDDINSSRASYVQQFWNYMAPRFANDSNVIFELYNEPINNSGTDAQKWSTVRGYMQSWYNLVRGYAPNNLILIGTPGYCTLLRPVLSNGISGNRFMYVVHTYPLHWNSSSARDEILQTAGTVPLFMSEWGFYATSNTLLNGTISNYGQPLVNTLDQYGISWTAWVAHQAWEPPMFWNNTGSLRVGQDQMGGFVKDALYSRRNSNQPSNGGSTGGNAPANGTFKVVNRNSGKGLDAAGAQNGNGTQIQQWSYNGGNNQRWTLLNRGNNQYSIIGVASGRAVDVNGASTANGTSVTLWDYTGGNNQKYTFSSPSSGYYRITPVHATGSCLDVSGNSTADGGIVNLWNYGGGNNQQWALSPP